MRCATKTERRVRGPMERLRHKFDPVAIPRESVTPSHKLDCASLHDPIYSVYHVYHNQIDSRQSSPGGNLLDSGLGG